MRRKLCSEVNGGDVNASNETYNFTLGSSNAGSLQIEFKQFEF